MPLGEETPLKRGHQRGVSPLRNRYFTTVSSSSVRRVADRHRRAALLLSGFTNIDDLERP